MQANSFKLTPIALSLLFLSHQTIAADDAEVVEVMGSVFDTQEAHINADELDKSQAQDLNDIFRKQAEVTVGGTSAVSQKIYVRGLESTMLNVSIDGATQSSSLFHHQGSVSVEPELLKQVDVSAGAGRATDGFGALGGAIKFKTKDALELLEQGEKFGATVKAGYYSNANAYKTSASVYGSVGNELGLLGSISYLDADDIVDGHGDDVDYTESQQASALLKLSGNLNEKNYISVSIDARDDSGTRLNRPNWAYGHARNPAFEQSTKRQTFTVNHLYTGNDLVNIDSTLYYTNASLLHDDNPLYGTTDGSLSTYGLKLQNLSKIGSHKLTYGFEFKNDKSDYESEDESKYGEEGSASALFIQDDWTVLDNLVVTAGARYEFYTLTDSSDKDFEAGDLSPNIGINYSPINGLELFASHAQAFRGQQVKELYLIYAANDSDLQPEKAFNNEIGVNYRYQNVIAGVNYFDSKIKDVIAYDYTSFNNQGELTNKGFNAYLGYNLSFLSAHLSYNQSNPELNGVVLSDDNLNIGTSVGDQWVMDVAYYASESLEFGWTGTFVQRLTDVADSSIYAEKPGYGVHDMYAQWLPIQDLTLTFSIKNIFDKYYADHASYLQYGDSTLAKGTPNAGRDFRLNAAYKF